MTALQYLLDLHDLVGGFFSIERPCERATNSELRRWLAQSALVVNGEVVKDPRQKIDLPVQSCVLFPKSPKKRITLL